MRSFVPRPSVENRRIRAILHIFAGNSVALNSAITRQADHATGRIELLLLSSFCSNAIARRPPPQKETREKSNVGKTPNWRHLLTDSTLDIQSINALIQITRERTDAILASRTDGIPPSTPRPTLEATRCAVGENDSNSFLAAERLAASCPAARRRRVGGLEAFGQNATWRRSCGNAASCRPGPMVSCRRHPLPSPFQPKSCASFADSGFYGAFDWLSPLASAPEGASVTACRQWSNVITANEVPWG